MSHDEITLTHSHRLGMQTQAVRIALIYLEHGEVANATEVLRRARTQEQVADAAAEAARIGERAAAYMRKTAMAVDAHSAQTLAIDAAHLAFLARPDLRGEVVA